MSSDLPIVLGTASPRRRKAFEEMGFRDFKTASADIDEKAIRREDPERLTVALARAKARAIISRLAHPALVVTADQVVERNGEIREKPESEAQAREYLATCHLAPLRVVNGMAATNTAAGTQAVGNEASRIVFREIPESAISRLIREGELFDWAGGFSVQSPLLIPFIASIEGEEGSGLGLPRGLTLRLIREVSS